MSEIQLIPSTSNESPFLRIRSIYKEMMDLIHLPSQTHKNAIIFSIFGIEAVLYSFG